jgi:hypothetical protein
LSLQGGDQGDALYLARSLTDDRSATALGQLFDGGKSAL